MAAKKFQPGTYRVTNTGRRNRVRDDVLYPGAKDGKSKGVPVDVHVSNRAQLHRLRACRFLDVEGPRNKPGPKPKNGDGGAEGQAGQTGATKDDPAEGAKGTGGE